MRDDDREVERIFTQCLSASGVMAQTTEDKSISPDVLRGKCTYQICT